MNVLVACEFSGTVRDAFAARGHNAWSCDISPSTSRKSDKHFVEDVRKILADSSYKWDLLIAHPPCTHLAVSGARWFPHKIEEQADAITFVKELWAAPIVKKCFENPVSVLSTRWKKPTQIIQPYQFGHCESKRTCLWLDGLPPLTPTKIVQSMGSLTQMLQPGPDRSNDRSVTYYGIAKAMAEQWG